MGNTGVRAKFEATWNELGYEAAMASLVAEVEARRIKSAMWDALCDDNARELPPEYSVEEHTPGQWHYTFDAGRIAGGYSWPTRFAATLDAWKDHAAALAEKLELRGQDVDEAEAFRVDAERYRCLRDDAPESWSVTRWLAPDLQEEFVSGDDLDAALDALRAAKVKK